MNKKLTRSEQDQQIAGVCAGIAEYLDIDPTLVRVVALMGMFFSGGSIFFLYLLLWMVMPEAGEEKAKRVHVEDTI